ncbi:MAG: DNA damage-inducible protein D [Firmicutes bacterium]|nr:DNA damage-inducible protein D [Bacillota bacterium]
MENNKTDLTFDCIRQLDVQGNEFWYARELMGILKYAKWENFHKVIKQAMISCKISQQDVGYNFPEVRKVAVSENGKRHSIKDYRLTRYACYLIVMNADPRKEVIALGQTYFAVKTRQQELQELYNRLSEDEKRLFLRSDIKQKNMLLAEVAHKAGINTSLEYAEFTNKGYEGLYGGLTAKDIAFKKGLDENQEILDYMGSEELGANLFRITQTEGVLKKSNVTNKILAGDIHYNVGKTVRKAIEEIGGTMPEDLPTPKKSIPQIQKEQTKQLKDKKGKK